MDKLKITIIEIDVQVTKDGIPVIYHPVDLSTHSNLNGKISDYPHNIIKKAKIIKHTHINQKLYIPSLYEVLSKFKNINFIIDLKSLPAKKLIDSIAKIFEARDHTRERNSNMLLN